MPKEEKKLTRDEAKKVIKSDYTIKECIDRSHKALLNKLGLMGMVTGWIDPSLQEGFIFLESAKELMEEEEKRLKEEAKQKEIEDYFNGMIAWEIVSEDAGKCTQPHCNGGTYVKTLEHESPYGRYQRVIRECPTCSLNYQDGKTKKID